MRTNAVWGQARMSCEYNKKYKIAKHQKSASLSKLLSRTDRYETASVHTHFVGGRATDSATWQVATSERSRVHATDTSLTTTRRRCLRRFQLPLAPPMQPAPDLALPARCAPATAPGHLSSEPIPNTRPHLRLQPGPPCTPNDDSVAHSNERLSTLG